MMGWGQQAGVMTLVANALKMGSTMVKQRQPLPMGERGGTGSSVTEPSLSYPYQVLVGALSELSPEIGALKLLRSGF